MLWLMASPTAIFSKSQEMAKSAAVQSNPNAVSKRRRGGTFAKQRQGGSSVGEDAF